MAKVDVEMRGLKCRHFTTFSIINVRSCLSIFPFPQVILSLEHGVWAPNLHYKNPNPDIPALHDGRIQVVSKPIPVKGGIVGINSFGFGGSNVHVILRPNKKKLSSTEASLPLPRLVQVCGRTQEAVEALIEKSRNLASDATLVNLLNCISGIPPSAMPYRGYTLVGTESDVKEIQQSQTTGRPLWYICSGNEGKNEPTISYIVVDKGSPNFLKKRAGLLSGRL